MCLGAKSKPPSGSRVPTTTRGATMKARSQMGWLGSRETSPFPSAFVMAGILALRPDGALLRTSAQPARATCAAEPCFQRPSPRPPGSHSRAVARERPRTCSRSSRPARRPGHPIRAARADNSSTKCGFARSEVRPALRGRCSSRRALVGRRARSACSAPVPAPGQVREPGRRVVGPWSHRRRTRCAPRPAESGAGIWRKSRPGPCGSSTGDRRDRRADVDQADRIVAHSKLHCRWAGRPAAAREKLRCRPSCRAR